MTRRVFLPIVAGAPAVLGYDDMLLVVEPKQPTASPGYSSTSATCCCPLLQLYLVLPVLLLSPTTAVAMNIDQRWM